MDNRKCRTMNLRRVALKTGDNAPDQSCFSRAERACNFYNVTLPQKRSQGFSKSEGFLLRRKNFRNFGFHGALNGAHPFPMFAQVEEGISEVRDDIGSCHGA